MIALDSRENYQTKKIYERTMVRVQPSTLTMVLVNSYAFTTTAIWAFITYQS